MFSSSKSFQKKNKTVYKGLKRKNKMDYQNGSIFKKNNKLDSHNILLLDGYSDIAEPLTYLDVRNMYLAVDDSNATHFSHFKRAKVDLVTGDYAEHLQDFIIKTLFSILRNL